MLQTLPRINRDSSFDGFNPQPLPIATQHLQSQYILLKEHRQTREIGMSANVVRFSSFMFGSRARVTDHPSNKILGGVFIIVHLEEVILGEFED